MNVKYFSDTDTLYLELSEVEVVETKELGDYLYVDLDSQGHVVGITVEHARQSGAGADFSYQLIGAEQTPGAELRSRSRKSA